jgi:pyruvate,water dikinase
MSTDLAERPPADSRYLLDDPADMHFTFMLDPMHHPHAVSPLYESVHGAFFGNGFAAAARELDLPLVGFDRRYRNHFQFDRVVPIIPASEAEAQRLAELTEASMSRELQVLDERWRNEHVPRLRDILARLETIGNDNSDISPDIVDEINALYEEMWTIHFRIAAPMLLAFQLFDEFYVDLFGPEADSHLLTSGRMSRTVRAGIALSDLASRAQQLGLADAFTLREPALVLSRLDETEAGRRFKVELDAYLEEYGLRQDRFDFVVPSWRESPDTVIVTIGHYLANGRDNRAEFEDRATKADAAADAARLALAGYPEPVRQQFEALLEMGRMASFLQEEHNDYIDQGGTAAMRLAYLRIGREFTARKAIDNPEDIFLLTYGEIRDALTGSPVALREIASERKLSFDAALEATPPPFIGAPPSDPPPLDNPFARGWARFFGTPPEPNSDPDILPGAAGSRGRVTAPAFVARTLEEATGVPQGHILVSITTTPPWTPLFGVAAAVVTETGGPLSHCAIVAREYAIPAVVGAAGATTAIITGQIITVDGTTGVVLLKP